MSVSATRRQPLNRVSVHRSSGSRSLFKLRNSGRPTDTPISRPLACCFGCSQNAEWRGKENETQIALSDSDRETARETRGEGALSGCRSQSNTVPEFNGTDKRLDGRNGVLTLRRNILPFRKGIDLVSLFLVTRSPINFTYDGIIAEMSCIIRAW